MAKKTAWDKAQEKLAPRKRGMSPAGDPPSIPATDHCPTCGTSRYDRERLKNEEWDKSVRHALLESQARLVEQRDGLKTLLDEAQSLLLRYVEKGHRCEDDDKVIDWGKRCNKALREFGQ